MKHSRWQVTFSSTGDIPYFYRTKNQAVKTLRAAMMAETSKQAKLTDRQTGNFWVWGIGPRSHKAKILHRGKGRKNPCGTKNPSAASGSKLSRRYVYLVRKLDTLTGEKFDKALDEVKALEKKLARRRKSRSKNPSHLEESRRLAKQWRDEAIYRKEMGASRKEIAEALQNARFYEAETYTAGVRKKRRSKNPSAAKGYTKFHGNPPSKGWKVRVPDSFPKKLWLLGDHHRTILKSGTVLSGGLVAAGTGNAIYLLGVKSNGMSKKKGRVTQIEYTPRRDSDKHGPTYYHPYKTPPVITKVKAGFYIIRGARQKLTSRGIIG
jgi:hypothetical protein